MILFVCNNIWLEFSYRQEWKGKYVFNACFLNFLTIQDVSMTIQDLDEKN